MERGDPVLAVQVLSDVVAEAMEVDQPFIAVDASVHLADARVRSGEPEQALETIEVAQELAGEDAALYEVPLRRVRAEALMALGRRDEASSHIEGALASARQQSLVYEEALLLLIKAEVGGPGVNGEVSEEADRLLEDLGASRPYLYRLPSPTL
jgi:ATP/maltotriose-dependent transcriptional regulator MalT